MQLVNRILLFLSVETKVTKTPPGGFCLLMRSLVKRDHAQALTLSLHVLALMVTLTLTSSGDKRAWIIEDIL